MTSYNPLAADAGAFEIKLPELADIVRTIEALTEKIIVKVALGADAFRCIERIAATGTFCGVPAVHDGTLKPDAFEFRDRLGNTVTRGTL